MVLVHTRGLNRCFRWAVARGRSSALPLARHCFHHGSCHEKAIRQERLLWRHVPGRPENASGDEAHAGAAIAEATIG